VNDGLPLASIILPVKDGTNTLLKALKKLEALDYPKDKLEIILINDNSSISVNDQLHGNLNNLKKNINLFVFRMPTNLGYYACMNYGIRKSKGKIIVLYAHDLFADKSFLKQAVRALDPNGDIGGVRCKVETNFEHLMPPLYFAPVGMYPLVYRKDIFDKVGLFDERFRSRGDSDFEFRVLKSNLQIVDCPSSVVFHPLRKLNLRTLVDYAKRRQYDILLYAKHPHMSQRILGGLLTGPLLGPLSPTGMILIILALIMLTVSTMYGNLLLPLIASVALVYVIGVASAAFLLNKVFPKRKISIKDRLEYGFWASLFLLAISFGRAYGMLKFRRFLL